MLGNTKIAVSELSFGTLILGWLQADMTPEAAVPAIQKACELGINFFDTAQSYRTQAHLREGLGQNMNKVVIATKTHAKTCRDAELAFAESLKELGRDYIDIYEFHLIENKADLENRAEVLNYLLGLKAKGLIRAIGASVHRVEAAKAIVEHPEMDILFPVFNAQGLGIIDGTAADMQAVCKTAKERGMGVYAMKPLAGGHLRENPKEAFDFIRNTQTIDSICTGMKSAAEVEMNVRLFEGDTVSKDILAEVATESRKLRIYERCIGCGACVETCDQGALSLDETKADEATGKKGQSVVDHSKCILCGYCAEVCPEFTIRII